MQTVAAWVQDLDLTHLFQDERDEVLAILENNYVLFDGTDLGPMAGTKHEIQTGNAQSDHQTPFRARPHERRVNGKEIERILPLKMAQPSHTLWSIPVLVPKHDGSTRFCIGYRKLNALVVRDSFPLPHMNDTVASLLEAKLFSSVNSRQDFWYIPVSGDDVPKTDLTTHKAFYEYVRMPLGLWNASATFQRNIDIILSGFK